MVRISIVLLIAWEPGALLRSRTLVWLTSVVWSSIVKFCQYPSLLGTLQHSPRSLLTSLITLPPSLFSTFLSTHSITSTSILSPLPVLLPSSFLATKPPTSLGQGPFQHILSQKMSTATPDKAAAPKLEKKPVKFSNLLLGAGLNMFEVTTLGQVKITTPP